MDYVNYLVPSVLSYLSRPAAIENSNSTTNHDGNTLEESDTSGVAFGACGLASSYDGSSYALQLPNSHSSSSSSSSSSSGGRSPALNPHRGASMSENEDHPPSSIPASIVNGAGIHEETLECGSIVSSLEEVENGNAPFDQAKKISIRKSSRNSVAMMKYDSDDDVEDIIVVDQANGQYDFNKRTKRTFLKQSRMPKQATPKSASIKMTGTVVSSTTKSRSDGKSSGQTDPSSDATLSSFHSDSSGEKCIQDLYSDFEKRRHQRHVKKVIMIFLAVICLIIVITSVFVAVEASKPEMSENQLLSKWGIGTSDQNDQAYSAVPSKQPSGLDSTSAPSKSIGAIGDDIMETQVPIETSLTDIPSAKPIPSPTDSPSSSPIEPQVASPTDSPSASAIATDSPSTQPILENDDTDKVTATFYVIGDLPYNDKERTRLIEHVNNLPDDAEFLVHVGDIRDAEQHNDCLLSEFEDVGDILKNSKVPVFIVPGDNEYNDCPNLSESWGEYMEVFGNFEDNWSSSIKASRDPERPENFFFVHKRVLYVGLNIVGGSPHSYSEWMGRLSYQFTWTKNLIETHVLSSPNDASSIVIFAHGDPGTSLHASFFNPLQYYIANDLKNEVPIIYINGDRHYFQFDQAWYGQESFHRIMVEGGSKEPPLQMKLSVPNSPDHGILHIEDVYTFDRQL